MLQLELDMSNRILRLPEVMAITGLPRSTIYAAMANGTFPASVKLSARSVGWSEQAVRKWIEERPVSSRQTGGGEAA